MDFKKLPKVELHCHLDGSLRVESVIEMAQKEGINLTSYSYDYVKELLTVSQECDSLVEYLKRFDLPGMVMQTKENLKRVSYELLEDAAKENVKYIEVRFAPLLHTQKGLSIKEIIENVLSGIKEAEKDFDIKSNLILSCLRKQPLETVFKVIEEGKEFIGKGVVAIDLAGAEDEGFVFEYIDPIKVAKSYGYRITIHAGETGFGKNVLDAIKMLGAERIGHGVYIYNNEEAYKCVKESGVILEMCPKSNIDTKAVKGYYDHPLYKYHKDGIKINISTDNRTVSNVLLSDECEKIASEFNMSFEDYKKIYLDSVEASFCDEETKVNLRKAID